MRHSGPLLAAALLLLVFVAPSVAVAQDVPPPTPPADAQRARVVDIIDGDTIRVDRGDGVLERLRYIGIDTPETVDPGQPVEPLGPEASVANAELVADREVLLERDISQRDRYDRLLRYVWVEEPDGWTMVNARLVALGLAEVRAYPPDTRHDRWLRQVEDGARAAGLGIHGDASGPPEPADGERNLLDDLLDFLFGR